MDQCLGTTNTRTQKELVGASGEIEKMASSVLNMPWDIQRKAFCGQLVIIAWSPGERFGSH